MTPTPVTSALSAPSLTTTAATLDVTGLSKRFGGVVALSEVGLSANAGEVMALIGENGAGKSTLVKILTGIYRPDAGEIHLDGQPLRLSNARAAADAGITAIHQEAVMFEDLSVADNIMMGRQPRLPYLRAIDWPTMRREAARHLREIGADISPDASVRSLSIAERHMVSIATALAQDARVLIFDEPTASLSVGEVRALFVIINQLKAAGKAIIFISHKFDEIFAIAGRYTVLRDGTFVKDGAIADTSQDELVRLMVGRPVAQIYPKSDVVLGDVVLDIAHMSHPTEFSDVSFSLRRGEILGFYGLVGAGRTELMEAVFGLKKISAGTTSIDGIHAAIHSPSDAIAHGLAYVPEDRQRNGGILSMAIRSNISLVALANYSRGFFLSRQREQSLAETFGRELSIKLSRWDQHLDELSGGNQQKVVISKWLATKPKIIIFDEPTKGIDIGSKIAVHEFIGGLVKTGASVILVSSELDEVIGLSDRIVVMHRGLVRARFDRAHATREAIVRSASGGN